MAIPEADPRAQDLDAAFAEAMSAPAKPRVEAKAPPEIDPDAPMGRDDDGNPLAPFGHNKDGSIRRTNAGRRAKDDPDQPRVGKVIPPQDKKTNSKKSFASEDDFTEGLVGAADGLWLLMTAAARLPIPNVGLGRFRLPQDLGTKLGAQAYVFDQSKGSLVVALNEAAKHNAKAHALAAKLSEGDATWVLTVASLAGPFLASSVALWKGDARLDVSAMNAANERQMDNVMEQLKAQAQAIAEQGMTAQAQAADTYPVQANAEMNGHPVVAQAG